MTQEFRALSPDDRRLYFWLLADERKKTAELQATIESLTQQLAQAQSDLTAHRAHTLDYDAQRVRMKDAEKALQALEAKTLSSLERIQKLVDCVQWTRDRDKTWRGVAVATVNERLDEVIRG